MGASRGPKTRRNPAVRDKIIEALRLGATNEIACKYAGIAQSTFYQWLQDEPELIEVFERARAHSAVEALRAIQKARQEGQWTASAWLLERRHGYAKPPSKVEVSGKLDLNVLIQKIQQMDDDALDALASGQADAIRAAIEETDNGDD